MRTKFFWLVGIIGFVAAIACRAQTVDTLTVKSDSLTLVTIALPTQAYELYQTNTMVAHYLQDFLMDKVRDTLQLPANARLQFIGVEGEVITDSVRRAAGNVFLLPQFALDELFIKQAPEPLKKKRPDNRFELLEIDVRKASNTQILINSAAIFGVVQAELINCGSGNDCQLYNPQSCGKKFGLCQSEPYWEQVSLCLGTAFLIHKEYVITARHVIENISLSHLCFVMGFRVLPETGQVKNIFRKEEVMYPEKVIRTEKLDQYDIAIIKLKSPTTLEPLPIRNNARISQGKRVYALGHPLGLPMKYTANGIVTDIKDVTFCESTLDTFIGNSGSPIFDETTHELIGMLTGGMRDFITAGDCNIADNCASVLCEQERFLNLLPLAAEIRTAIGVQE